MSEAQLGIYPLLRFVLLYSHPTENYASNLDIPLRPIKDVAVDLHIKALVGYEQRFT